MRRIALLAVSIVFLTACGSSDSSGPRTEFTGAYAGTERFTSGGSGVTSMSVTVVQNGSSVSGSYSTGTGDRGSFTGTIDDGVFQGTATSAVLGLSCVTQGSLANGGGLFTGTIACSNGVGGTITLTRV